jgi:hypothetical protein
MAIGSFDGKIRIVSCYSWQLAFVLSLVHPKDLSLDLNVHPSSANVIPIVEIAGKDLNECDDTSSLHGDSSSLGTFFVSRKLKSLPRCTSLTITGSLPCMGVHWIEWSAESGLIVAREESFPRCLWIWMPFVAKLVAVIVLIEKITFAKWRPINNIIVDSKTVEIYPLLAFSTGTSTICFWNEIHGVLSIQVSPSIEILSFQWSVDGTCLLLDGKEKFTIVTLNNLNIQKYLEAKN